MASEELMTQTDTLEGVATPYDSLEESAVAAHASEEANNNEEESVETPAKVLPSLETMEDLILEAYNNMQSDGEHIFLPEEVVSKLRLLAQLKNAEYSSDDVVSQSSESNQEENLRSLIPSIVHSAASSTPSSPPPRESVGSALLHDVSALYLDDNNAVEAEQRGTVNEEHRALDAGMVEIRIDTNIASVEAEYSGALSPVEEVSEDVLSIDDLHFDAEPLQDTLTPTPSPTKSAASPSEKPSRAVEAPVSRLRKPEVHRRKSIVPPPPRSLTKAPSASKIAAAPKSAPTASHVRTETAAPTSSRDRSSSSYEQRREAAQKFREEKAQRELQVREAARKQREDARRKLEEVQQRELAAKRDRVARMKMQKDNQRKTSVGTTKPAAAR